MTHNIKYCKFLNEFSKGVRGQTDFPDIILKTLNILYTNQFYAFWLWLY